MIPDTIELNKNVTFTFTPEQVSIIVTALGEAPYRVSKPLLEYIVATIQTQQESGN